MNRVETVTGPVDLDGLDTLLVHEHLRTAREPVYVQFPDLRDRERELARVVPQVKQAMSRGVQAICDPTVMGLDRDVHFIREVAEATGMTIIAATGLYTYDQIPPYFQWRSVDDLANAFVSDIERGIQGTQIKAGFLKCSTDLPGVTPDVEKVLRAVARAHRQTGAPIMTHSNPSNRSGLAQLDVFDDEGVDLTRVLVGHSGDAEDADYLEAIAERGAYLGMDRFGMNDFLAHDKRLRSVVETCRRGYASRMMLSSDHVCFFDRGFPKAEASQRTTQSLTLIVDRVMPELEGLGVEQEALRAMVGANVRGWLERRPPY